MLKSWFNIIFFIMNEAKSHKNPSANESLHFHMKHSNNPQKLDILMKKKTTVRICWRYKLKN